MQRAERVAAGTYELEVDTGCADAGLCVGDAEEDDFVAAPFEAAGQTGHGVNMSSAGEAEGSEPRHGLHLVREIGPEEITDGGSIQMLKGVN